MKIKMTTLTTQGGEERPFKIAPVLPSGRTHVARAKCLDCGDVMISSGGGVFLHCKCGKSFIDQERWSGAYVRMGGNVKFISQVCPKTCTDNNHKENDKEK